MKKEAMPKAKKMKKIAKVPLPAPMPKPGKAIVKPDEPVDVFDDMTDRN